jgi:hypothetical protein
MDKDKTCHYERDKEGKWWVVWGSDFLGDGSGRIPADNSEDLEAEYQKALMPRRKHGRNT